MKKEIMKEFGLFAIMMILFCATVTAIIVPRGESVKVSLISQTPDPIEPGGYVELRFRVENIGAEYAKNVRFELLPEYPFSLDKGVSATRQVGDMYMYQVEEEAYVAYYKVRVDKDAIDGNNEIKARYTTDDGLTWSRSDFDIRVQTSEAIISVDDVSLNPEQIAPGATAQLKISIKNNADSLLKNVKVNIGVVTTITTSTSVTITELPITPIGSANEKMIENIAPDESKDVIFNIIADADAVSKIYKMPINVEYADILGANYSKTYYTSIIVGDEPELVASIESSDIVYSGKAGTISIRFTNKGASDLKFLYVELMQSDSYEIISSPSVYIGNIDSDDYESADFNIYVKGTRNKAVQLPMKIEYRDANNKKFKKEMILSLKLYSSSTAERYGLVASGNPVYTILLIIIILLVIRWYVKRKKKVDIFAVFLEKVKYFFHKIKNFLSRKKR